MIDANLKGLLEKFGDTQVGTALREHLKGERETLDRLKTITSWDEVIGRQREMAAITRLLGLFEKPNPQSGTKKVDYT